MTTLLPEKLRFPTTKIIYQAVLLKEL